MSNKLRERREHISATTKTKEKTISLTAILYNNNNNKPQAQTFYFSSLNDKLSLYHGKFNQKHYPSD